MPVTGYGYALDPLRSVGVGEKNEGQGVIPRPFMCVGSFACLTAGASGGQESSGSGLWKIAAIIAILAFLASLLFR